jgi:hypothetical protein
MNLISRQTLSIEKILTRKGFYIFFTFPPLPDVEHLGLLVYGPKKVVEKLTKEFELFS